MVLDDTNLWILRGKCIALVGKSGTGKTSLVDVILCLLQSDRVIDMGNYSELQVRPKKIIIPSCKAKRLFA